MQTGQLILRIAVALWLMSSEFKTFADDPKLNVSFDRNQAGIPSGFIGKGRGISGNCFENSQQKIPPDIHLPDVSGDFTLSMWLKIDELPGNGQVLNWDDQTPVTIFTLSSQDNQDVFILRLFKTSLELALKNDPQSKYQTFRGAHTIPLKQWVLITLAYNNDRFAELRLNGLLDIRTKIPDPAPQWNSLALGHLGKYRILTGRFDEIKLFDTALSLRQIRQCFEQYGQPESFGSLPQSDVQNIYKALMVTPETLHPLQEQMSIDIAIVDWNANNSPCILLTGGKKAKYFSRNALFTPCDHTPHGMPVYDTGKTLDLIGEKLQVIPRTNGLFDLAGSGKSALYGGENIVYYKNLGSLGNPKFTDPAPIDIDGKSFKSALGISPSSWHIEDVTGDGIEDLLATGHNPKHPLDKWPDCQSPWDSTPQPNCGKGRGYSINGEWLAEYDTSTLFWAKGNRNHDGTLSFENFKPVYYQYKGFAVQWKSPDSSRALALMKLNGIRYLLHAGSTDELLAMPVHMTGNDLFCEQALPVLKSGPSVSNSYYFQKICVYDMDADGHEEILMAGNNTRTAVLKGTAMGKFEEVEPLLMKGGDICVDTLAVPCRVDWDSDGYPDLIIGDSSGLLTFWPGTTNPIAYGAPVYMKSEGKRVEHQAGMTGSIQGPTEKRWGYLNPTIGDWDDDGELDIITGDITSDIALYKKTSHPLELTPPEYFIINGQRRHAAWRVRPAILPSSIKFNGINYPTLLYIDWDGFAAVAVPQEKGSTVIDRNVRLKYETGEDILLCGIEGLWGRGKIAIADWDEDGDWDILYGIHQHVFVQLFKKAPQTTTMHFFENTGTSRNPVFKRPVMIKSADDQIIDMGMHVASVWPSDLNGDGQLDLLVGAEDGKVYYFYRNELKWDE